MLSYHSGKLDLASESANHLYFFPGLGLSLRESEWLEVSYTAKPKPEQQKTPNHSLTAEEAYHPDSVQFYIFN